MKHEFLLWKIINFITYSCMSYACFILSIRDETDEDASRHCKTDWLNQMLPQKTVTKATDLIIQHAKCAEDASTSCR